MADWLRKSENINSHHPSDPSFYETFEAFFSFYNEIYMDENEDKKR